MTPLRVEVRLGAEHSAARGHFPGNPLIPGAVLLSEVLRALGESLDEPVFPCAVRSAKFLHPVRPGDTMTIEFRSHEGSAEFIGKVGSIAVMKGEVDWRSSSKAK